MSTGKERRESGVRPNSQFPIPPPGDSLACMKRPYRKTEELLLREDDRYARLRLISWWEQERLSASVVLVAGAGALGNEICKTLALVGASTIIVADFDEVEISNLSRAVLFRNTDAGRAKVEVVAERLRELNPAVRVVPLALDVRADLGLGWFLEADVVLGALDNREARLWLNRLAWRAGTPWIDGGIQEIAGQVRVYLPPGGACYECGMTDADYANLNLRYSCPGLRRRDIEEGKVPTTPTIAAVIAGLQVQEALKLLHDRPPERSTAIVFDGTENHFYTTGLVPRKDCLSHETWPAPRGLPLRAADCTVAQLLETACPAAPDRCSLELDRDLVEAFLCPACGAEEPVLLPAMKVGEERLPCPRCGTDRALRACHRIEGSSPLASKTLADVGVPAFDAVRVRTPAGSEFLLLDGDGP